MEYCYCISAPELNLFSDRRSPTTVAVVPARIISHPTRLAHLIGGKCAFRPSRYPRHPTDSIPQRPVTRTALLQPKRDVKLLCGISLFGTNFEGKDFDKLLELRRSDGLKSGRPTLNTDVDAGEVSRQRRGARRTLRSRHVQNWIWLTVMAIGGFTLFRPTWNLHDGPIERAIDLLGLLFLLIGLGIRVAARGWKHEAPGRNLVTDGLYGYVRHPLYVGSFLIGVGLCALAGSLWLVLVFCVCFWLSHGAAIRSEEATLKRQWPAEYGVYRAQVGALWPRWSAIRGHEPIRPRRLWEALLRESDAICIWLLVAIALELWEKAQMDHGLRQHRPEAAVLVLLAVLLGLGWRNLRVRAQSLGR